MSETKETQEIVDALSRRIALALHAATSGFRYCEPSATAVLEAVARYLDNPDDALAQLEVRREVERKSRYIR